MCDISNPIFHNETKARRFLEAQRWSDGVFCPYCGQLDTVHELGGKEKGTGWHHCNSCRKRFTVRVGTLYERSHIPLHKWLMATHLMCSSKKGISAHQLHRMLGISYKSAWFMAHRIREGMREGKPEGGLGGPGKVVEVDETFVGGKEKNKHRSQRTKGNIGGKGKEVVFSLVERQGRVSSHHVSNVSGDTLRPILRTQIDRASRLMTDDGGARIGREFAKHETVNHSIGEYVRGDVHTNTIEGYFSLLKRGIIGCYFHVSEAHLKRYLAEFDFRYNYRIKLGHDDFSRMLVALNGIEGKRLTYRRIDQAANA